MSLIKCPECEKEISNKAVSCPHCGCPINSENISDEPLFENNYIIHPLVGEEEKNSRLLTIKQYLKNNPPQNIKTKIEIVDIKPQIKKYDSTPNILLLVLLVCTIAFIVCAILCLILVNSFSACISVLLIAAVFGFFTYYGYSCNRKNEIERQKYEAALKEYEENSAEREKAKQNILDSYYAEIDEHDELVKFPCKCHSGYYIASETDNIVFGHCEKCFRGAFIGLANSDGTIYSSQRILNLFNSKDFNTIWSAVLEEVQNIKNEMNQQDAEDYIALSVLSGIIQSQGVFGYPDINQFTLLTKYTNLSHSAQDLYAKMLYDVVNTETLYSDGSHGSSFSSFYYPIYCVLTASSSGYSCKIKAVLQKNQYGETSTQYDDVMQMYNEHKAITRSILAVKEATKPKCPMCGSTNVKKISTLNRALSVELAGIASAKIGKQYQCANCKHLF